MRAALAGAVLIAAALGGGCGGEPRPTVTLYAAASLGPALEEVIRRFEGESGYRVAGDLAASSVLARRIGAGAPAQVFVSANPDWMDWLEERGELISGTRVDLLANSLVLIAPAGRGFAPPPPGGLAAAFEGRFALADPDHVPLGIYTREALRASGDWGALADRAIPAGDARATLRLVQRGECAAGIVYRTDAIGSTDVEVVAEIPESRHRPIVYPAALVGGGRKESVALFQFLVSAPALEIFERHGFRVLAAPGPAR